MHALVALFLLAAPAAPTLEGVVERTEPGASSPKLDKLAEELGPKLHDCLSDGDLALDVEVKMRSSGPELKVRVWARVNGKRVPAIMRGEATSETRVRGRLAEVQWPLAKGEQALFSFTRTPHNAAQGMKGWAFYSASGALEAAGSDRSGIEKWDEVRESLVRCGLTGVVGVYTAAGKLRAYVSAGRGGHKGCVEKVLRALDFGSNSYGGEFCVAFGPKPLRSCPVTSILLSKDDPKGVVNLESTP